MEDDRPLAAFGLSLAGGVLIFVGGAVLAILSGVASSVGANAAGAVFGGLGALGLLLGFLVMVFAGLLYTTPEHHAAYGIVIVVLSLASIFGGGGFLIGLVLGLVGGVLAIRFDYPEEPMFEWEGDRSRLGAPGSPVAPARSTPSSVCANCHATVPRGADRCPSCETPVAQRSGGGAPRPGPGPTQSTAGPR